MASGDSVEQIKQRLTIVDVVSSYVELNPAGKNMKGKSPFTNERTPSFYVSPDRGMYYCFSSSQGGDMFTFVQKMEGVDFKGALKMLAERAGVELVAQDPQKKNERDRLFDALEAATVFYTDYLAKKRPAMEYLLGRGVKPQTIAKWRIGYAPGPDQHGWREGKQDLEAKGFTVTELLKAGLIKGADAGKEPYDLFRDRIMFPICDPSGRVVGFSGRILSKDSDAPKYVNSPETELFNKSEVLFGYDKAKQHIRSMDFTLIVEGQFDVIMSHQAGYQNAIAVSGTAFTSHHAGLLQRLSNRVVLALDNDRAGIAAVKRAADLLLARGMDVKVARMEGGKDPADMVVHDVNEFKHCIGKARHVIEYLLDILEAECKDERTYKLRAREEILPFVLKIPNQIDQEHFEHSIASRLGTTKEAVHTEVERVRVKQAQVPAATLSEEESRTVVNSAIPISTIERLDKQRSELLGYLVALTEIVDAPIATKIHEVLMVVTGKETGVLREALAPEIMSQLLFTLEERVQGVPKAQLRADVAHAAEAFALRTYKEELRLLKQSLTEVEGMGGDSEPIIRAIAEVQRKIGSVRYNLEDFT
jgi:DNA primase